MNTQQDLTHWASVDWGDQEHAVVVVDSNRRVQRAFRIQHTPQGMASMASTLREFPALRGVAIESHRGLLMVYLLQQGFTVYPINPKLSHAWRKNDSVSACKSDERDGRVLAQELAMRHEALKPVLPEDDLTRQLAMLCDDEQDLIRERTSMVQALQSTLKQYFPAALRFFSDWTAPVAWAWLKRFTTPKQLASASENSLYRFLKGHRIGLTAKWQERVKCRKSACDWPVDTALTEAYAIRALQLIHRLQTVQSQLDIYRQRIETLHKTHLDHALFDSLPGAGAKLAPRLLSIFGTDRERYESSAPVRQLSGTAPVTRRSGRKLAVNMRQACRKQWRNVLHQFAWCSTRHCGWAQAFYEYRRSCGDKSALALRKLADTWLKIIYRMWQTRTLYDDALHMKDLRKKNSPLLRYLPVDNAVDNSKQIARPDT